MQCHDPTYPAYCLWMGLFPRMSVNVVKMNLQYQLVNLWLRTELFRLSFKRKLALLMGFVLQWPPFSTPVVFEKVPTQKNPADAWRSFIWCLSPCFSSRCSSWMSSLVSFACLGVHLPGRIKPAIFFPDPCKCLKETDIVFIESQKNWWFYGRRITPKMAWIQLAGIDSGLLIIVKWPRSSYYYYRSCIIYMYSMYIYIWFCFVITSYKSQIVQ